MRVRGWTLSLLLALAAGPAVGQLQGGVQQSQASSTNERGICQAALAGHDPLTEDPEVMPMVVGGGAPPRCVPPSSTWSLAGQDGDNCCYLAPKATPIPGAVIPIGDVGRAEAQGARCGANAFDPSADTAVCTGPPQLIAQLQGEAVQHHATGGASGGSAYSYPAPVMVGGTGASAPPPQRGSLIQPPPRTLRGGTSGGNSGRGSSAPTGAGGTVVVPANGFNVIVSISGIFPLNKNYKTPLVRQANSNSPYTSAVIAVLRNKSASQTGLVRVVSVSGPKTPTKLLGLLKEF